EREFRRDPEQNAAAVAPLQEADQTDHGKIERLARSEGEAGRAVQLVGVGREEVGGGELGRDGKGRATDLNVGVESALDGFRSLRRNLEAGIDQAADVQDDVALTPGVAG